MKTIGCEKRLDFVFPSVRPVPVHIFQSPNEGFRAATQCADHRAVLQQAKLIVTVDQIRRPVADDVKRRQGPFVRARQAHNREVLEIVGFRDFTCQAEDVIARLAICNSVDEPCTGFIVKRSGGLRHFLDCPLLINRAENRNGLTGLNRGLSFSVRERLRLAHAHKGQGVRNAGGFRKNRQIQPVSRRR